jgi:hypothetical protein
MSFDGVEHIRTLTIGQIIPAAMDIKNIIHERKMLNSFDEA